VVVYFDRLGPFNFFVYSEKKTGVHARPYIALHLSAKLLYVETEGYGCTHNLYQQRCFKRVVGSGLLDMRV
jgi:hypothetical protein